VKPDDIQDLIGCEVRTSYGTGGKVVYVSQYYGDNKDRFTINYIDPRDHRRCIINGIRWEGEKFKRYGMDEVYFSGTPAPRQLSLF
jgi:hypothetical protein